MGLLSALRGNATAVDVASLQEEFQGILASNERVECAFRVVRDRFIFTDRRLIREDKQGMTGKKVSYQSIPYKSIRYFEVETAGHFDSDSELSIWVANMSKPIELELKGTDNVLIIQKTLAEYVLR